MTIKAIETSYAGCRFRSRLEARWAVFFDALQVIWEYEQQGLELNDGTRYLPDFWLPQQRVWLEVKGRDGDITKWRALHTQTNTDTGYSGNACGDARELLETVYLGERQVHGLEVPDRTFLAGEIPRPDGHLRPAYDISGSLIATRAGFPAMASMLGPGSPHSGFGWGRCTRCDVIEIGHVAWPVPLGCGHADVNFTDRGILTAYGAARAARFEHGESG